MAHAQSWETDDPSNTARLIDRGMNFIGSLGLKSNQMETAEALSVSNQTGLTIADSPP